MATISIGTGDFQGKYNIYEIIKFIKKLGADGIELNLGCTESIDNLDITKIKKMISDFDFITIHGPGFYDMSRNKFEDKVKKIEEIRKKINAKNVVYHPDYLPNLEIVDNISKVAIENMSSAKDFTSDDFENFVKNTKVPVVIDLCHAYTRNNLEFFKLYNKYMDRISHFHISAYNGSEHQPLYKNTDFLDSNVAEILSDKKLVIESIVKNKKEMRKEFEFVRDVFS